MSQYVSIDGQQFLQTDEGVLIPVSIMASMDGGTLMQLRADQIALLQSPNLPATYPLPQDQVDWLRNVFIKNFPSNFAVNNWPAGFAVSNLPSTYPLPLSQETLLAEIRGWLLGSDRGNGVPTSNTLRTAIANLPTEYPLPAAQHTTLANILNVVGTFSVGAGNTQLTTLRVRVSNDSFAKSIGAINESIRVNSFVNLPTIGTGDGLITRSRVNASTSPVSLKTGSSTARSLTIHNESPSVLYLGAVNADNTPEVSTTSYTVRLFPGDTFSASNDVEANNRWRGVWGSATGAALVTVMNYGV